MKYSILIPSYDPTLRNLQTVTRLIESIELNSKGMDYELIMRKNGPSYTESHNDALRSSRGDYIVILNDDTLVRDPEWLQKLTSDTHIMSWRQGMFHLTGEPIWDFSLWAMSRPIFEKIGYFDEQYKNGINYEDNDYHYKAKAAGIDFKIVPVEFVHYGGLTLAKTPNAEDKRSKNHRIFYEKWLLK